jgi:hypothetical protein
VIAPSWHFPPVPLLFAIGFLWAWLREKNNPGGWMLAPMASIAILSYLYGNIVPILFIQTPLSMTLAATGTVVPTVFWSLKLIRRQRVEIGNPEYSDMQLFLRAIGGLAIGAIGTYAAAFAPSQCSNTKCEVGVSLFGPLDFAATWFASMWCGWMASFSLLIIYGIARRRLSRDR